MSELSAARPGPGAEDDYGSAADAVLTHIESCCDRWLQSDVIDIDTHRTGGLLELTFPGGSKIVVNQQPPLRELWLAARDGGFHYRQDAAGQWRDTRDGSELLATLSRLASAQAGKTLQF